MPSLEDRVARLEAALGGGGAADTYQPAFMTVDANGQIAFDFTGNVHAQSISLDAQPIPADHARSIIWKWPANGFEAATIIADHVPGPPNSSELIMLAESTGKSAGIQAVGSDTLADQTRVLAIAATKGAVLLDDTDRSDFVRSTSAGIQRSLFLFAPPAFNVPALAIGANIGVTQTVTFTNSDGPAGGVRPLGMVNAGVALVVGYAVTVNNATTLTINYRFQNVTGVATGVAPYTPVLIVDKQVQ